MKVNLAARALQRARIITAWWRKNRPVVDDLDEEERVALDRELEASIQEADAGQTVDFGKALAELRQRM